MGTRADFYVGIRKLLWLGSVAWDGYPEGMEKGLLQATTEEDFMKNIPRSRKDFTAPEDGWPWPWETSSLTDYAYVFNPKTKKVRIHCFDKKRKWPNMKNVQKTAPAGTDRSGVMVFYSKS